MHGFVEYVWWMLDDIFYSAAAWWCGASPCLELICVKRAACGLFVARLLFSWCVIFFFRKCPGPAITRLVCNIPCPPQSPPWAANMASFSPVHFRASISIAVRLNIFKCICWNLWCVAFGFVGTNCKCLFVCLFLYPPGQLRVLNVSIKARHLFLILCDFTALRLR